MSTLALSGHAQVTQQCLILINSATPKPARPRMAFASTTAVAEPPTRPCKIAIMFVHMTAIGSITIFRLKRHRSGARCAIVRAFGLEATAGD